MEAMRRKISTKFVLDALSLKPAKEVDCDLSVVVARSLVKLL
jgi:hypothetical protein